MSSDLEKATQHEVTQETASRKGTRVKNKTRKVLSAEETEKALTKANRSTIINPPKSLPKCNKSSTKSTTTKIKTKQPISTAETDHRTDSEETQESNETSDAQSASDGNCSNKKKRNSKAKYSPKRKATSTKSKKNTFNKKKKKKKVSSTDGSDSEESMDGDDSENGSDDNDEDHNESGLNGMLSSVTVTDKSLNNTSKDHTVSQDYPATLDQTDLPDLPNIPPQSASEIKIPPPSQTTQRSSEDNLLPLGEFSVDSTALTLQDIRAIESCVGELEDLTMYQEHGIPYPAPASLNVAKILLELVEEIRILNIRGSHLQKQNEQIYLMLAKGHVAGVEGGTKKTVDYEVPRFPLKSLEEQQDMESRLETSEDFRHTTVLTLSSLGGTSVEESVPIIMKMVFTKELSLKYNAQKAIGDKLSFKSTALYKFVLEAIRVRHPKVDLNKIHLAMGLHFTRAPDLKGGREERRVLSALKKTVAKRHLEEAKEILRQQKESEKDKDETE